MKKSIAILLLVTYCIFNSSILFHYHYCGGELSSFSLLSKAEKPCECDSESEMDGCCEEMSVWYKIKDDQQSKSTCFCSFNTSFFLNYFPENGSYSLFDFESTHLPDYLIKSPPILFTGTALFEFVRCLLL